MNYLAFIGVTAATAVVSCTPAKKEYASYELYPVRSGSPHGDGIFTGVYQVYPLGAYCR